MWMKIGGGPLLFAALFHAILLILAAFWIFQIIKQPEKTVDFMPPGGGGGERAAQQVAVKKLKQITPTTNVKRVFAEGATASYAIPEQGDNFGEMSVLSSLAGGGLSGGLGGSGSGSGFGRGNGNGSGLGTGAGTGKLFGPAGLFGGKGEREGIEGTFIDFKLKRDGEKRTGTDPAMPNYIKILQAFKRGGWDTQKEPHYTPDTKLTSKFFFFPVMQDRLAAPAFDSKDSGPGLWVAHYRGRITASVPGKYRFVGYGDNLLAVKIGRKLVLDASNVGVYGGDAHEQVGSGTDHPSRNLPIFAGDWVNFGRGEEEIEIVVGDQGGVFCAGLYIQPQGTPISIVNGLPKLPLFLTGPVTDEERALLKQVPADSLNGPFFPAKTSSKPGI